jgi:hypothetical protein
MLRPYKGLFVAAFGRLFTVFVDVLDYALED